MKIPFTRTPIRQLLQANLEHSEMKLEEYACIAEQEHAFVAQYSSRIKRINYELARPDCSIQRTLETNRYEAERELEKHTCNFEQASAFVSLHRDRRARLSRQLAELPEPRIESKETSTVNGFAGQGA